LAEITGIEKDFSNCILDKVVNELVNGENWVSGMKSVQWSGDNNRI
jgi:hypothetical protein